MSIFDFTDFIINESIAEAKSIINSYIQQGKLDDTEFTNPESVYNQIKNMLQKNPGYTGFFVRKYYTERADIDYLQQLYNKLLRLKEYKININLQQYNKKTLTMLNDEIDLMLLSREDVPGLVIHENSATKALRNFILKSDYRYILCVKNEGGKWVPDHNAILWWGSPNWCLKSKSTFSCSYAKSPDHLQYVIIHKDIIEEIKDAAVLGRNQETRLVPRNYDLSLQTSYKHTWDSVYRIGVTTSPLKINQNPFKLNTSNDYPIQNDVNSWMNKSTFYELMLPVQFENLDMAVRSLLNLNKSQFDTAEYGLIDLLNYVKIDFDNTRDQELINTLRTMYDVIKKHLSTALFQTKILPETIAMMQQTPNTFLQLHYFLFFVKNVSNDLLIQYENYYSVDDLEKLPLNYTFSVVQIYMESRHNNLVLNEKIIKLTNKLIQKYVDELLDIKSSDNLAKPIDFKTMLLKTYNRQNPVYNYLPIGTLSLDKITKLLADYLFQYNNQQGKDIIKDKKWDSEQEFAQIIIAKNKAGSTTDYEGADVEFKRLFNKHLSSFDNDKVTFLFALKHTSEKKEYDVDYHNSCVRSAMQYYISEINPSLKSQL